MPSRRQLLATGSALCLGSLTGCAGRSLADWNEPARKLVLTVYDADESLREQYVVAPNETRSPVDDEAFAAAVAGETYTTRYRTPFGARDGRPEYARHDGTYYRLGSVVVGEETVTHPVLRLYRVGSADDDAVPAHVPKDDLPEGDQRAVQIAWFAARARNDEGGVPWGLVQRGGYVYRRESAVEESVLLDDGGPDHVSFREDVYRVEVSRETFHETEYRAEVEPVATSEAKMEEILRARLVSARLDPDALSPDERDIVERALREGYAESHPYSDAYTALLKRMGHRAYLDGDVEKDAGVSAGSSRLRTFQYGDRYYEYRLRFETEAT